MNATPDPDPEAPGSTSTYPPATDAFPVAARPGDPAAAAPPASDSPFDPAPFDPAPPVASPAAPPLGKWLLVYTLLRFATLLVLTALLSLLMPLILALLFAVVLALPLSWVLFGGVRRRVNEAMAVKSSSRRNERERLRAALDGREAE